MSKFSKIEFFIHRDKDVFSKGLDRLNNNESLASSENMHVKIKHCSERHNYRLQAIFSFKLKNHYLNNFLRIDFKIIVSATS